MATNYSNQALPKVTAKGVGFAQDKKIAWGTYELTDSGPMAATSVIWMCKVPKGAVITGGRVYGDKIDSTGTGSALASIHIGLSTGFTAADGTVYGATTATACLQSSLAVGPDAAAVTGYKDGVRNWPFGGLVVTNGPLLVADDALVGITWTASALALTTGTINLEVEYYTATIS